MLWEYNSLLLKFKKFIRRVHELEDRTSELFPFWCVLSLELLARASLAKISPALLADNGPRDTESILYAVGIESVKNPKSISTNIVLKRCQKIIKNFTEGHLKFSLKLINKRNEELHTGGSPFDNELINEWLPEFYQVMNVFLDYNGQEFGNFLDLDDTDLATKMIETLLSNKKKEAYALIHAKKDSFDKLSIDQRLEMIQKSRSPKGNMFNSTLAKNVDCPSCEGGASIFGEIIRSSTPREVDGELVQDDFYLPNKLKCYSCGLLLEGYEYLQGIGFGEPYHLKDVLDPVEHFDVDISEYLNPEIYDEYNH